VSTRSVDDSGSRRVLLILDASLAGFDRVVIDVRRVAFMN
jgi:hypothetical protein